MNKKDKNIMFKEFCYVRNSKYNAREQLQKFYDSADLSPKDAFFEEKRKTLIWVLDYWNAKEDEVYLICKKLGLDFSEFEKMYGESK